MYSYVLFVIVLIVRKEPAYVVLMCGIGEGERGKIKENTLFFLRGRFGGL